MRLSLPSAILLFALSGAPALSAQAASTSTCKVETADIGTIVGRGPSNEAAFEDAATQCFERRRQLHKARYNRESDTDTGELYIDVCVNVKCS